MPTPEHSIEWNAQELTKLRLEADTRLAAFTFVHWDRYDPADINAIPIRAVKGDVNLEGFGGYHLTVTVTFQTSELDEDAADQLALAISDSMYKVPDDFEPDLPDLLGAILEKETQTTRSDTRKFRKRTVSFPWIMALFS